MCAALAKAVNAERGPVPPGRYLHYYYHDTDEIVYSSGSSSEGPKEEDWVARYHEHVRKGAAGEVGPIKTTPKLKALQSDQPARYLHWILSL